MIKMTIPKKIIFDPNWKRNWLRTPVAGRGIVWIAIVCWMFAGSLVMGDDYVIDSFQYATPAAAQTAWPAFLAGQPVMPVTEGGVSCLSLPNAFTTSTVRGYWDRTMSLDLSSYSVIAVRLKSTRPSMYMSLYFITTGGGCYVKHFYITNQWRTYVFPISIFGTEGTVNGWNNISKVRLSCWQLTDPTPATAYVSDLQAGINLLPNSGFELTTAEAMPDYWGPATGSWGTAVEAWVLDTDSWRTRWGVDRTVNHTPEGSNSLRIVSTTPILPELNAVSNWITLKANQTYTLSVWLRSSQANLPVTLQINGCICTPSSSTSVIAPNIWERRSFTFTPTSSSNFGHISCLIYPTADGTLWVDDVQLENGTSATAWQSSLTDSNMETQTVHKTVPVIADRVITPGGDSVAVSIDSNHRFLIDGQPFIPMAIGWEAGMPSSDVMEHLAKAGFNTIAPCLTSSCTIENIRTFLDNAKANGLKVIIWAVRSVPIDTLGIWINGLKDHPAVIMWYVYDEPYTSQEWADANAKYDLAKQLDHSRPAMVNALPSLTYTNWKSDVLSMDEYPIGNVDSISSISRFGTMVETLHQVAETAVPDPKPTWCWLQSTGYAYFKYREPTSAESECMAYLALINGSRGIMYFSHKPRLLEQWNEIRLLNDEIRTLTPVLYSTDAAPDVSVNSSSIHLLSKRYNGQNYVIAVNVSSLPVTAALTISGADGWVMFENRLVHSSGGVLTDTFAGYQRHVYRIDDANLHLALDESAGASVAVDCSGSGNNGTLTMMDPATDWVGGKIGNALDFDGVNDYVNCGNSASLQLTGDLTLSFWIKPTNVSARRQNPLDKSYSGEFSLNIETNGKLSYFHHQTASPYYWSYYTTNVSIQSGIWQHIVVTRDATARNVKFYYNGVLKNTSPTFSTNALPSVSANSVLIGKGYSNCFTGRMDDVRIYSRALSQDEITELANP